MEIARSLGDSDAMYDAVAGILTSNRWQAGQVATVMQLAREFAGPPPESVSAYLASRALRPISHFRLAAGDRAGMEQVESQLTEIAARSHDPFTRVQPLIGDVIRATLDGRLEEAAATCERLVAQGEEQGSPVLGLLESARLSCSVQMYLGRPDRGVSACDALFARTGLVGPEPVAIRRNLCALEVGADRAASDELRKNLDQALRWAPDDVLALDALLHLEVALALADRDAARVLLPYVQDLAEIPFSPYTGDLGSFGRRLGPAAEMLGERRQARDFYQAALTATARIGHRPEHARTRLQLAELQLSGAAEEQAEAQANLDFAIKEFRGMNMQPYLQRALRHKGLLRA